MRRLWDQVVSKLGAAGLAGLAIIAASVVFFTYVVTPLEETDRQLDRQLARAARNAQRTAEAMAVVPSARGIEGFYAFFDRPETSTDWLAKFHGAAVSTGIVVRSAEYKVIESKKRLERYQVTVPITGAYTQIRAFIDAALTEIPVLSLDQVRMRRARGGSGIEADLMFSLYESRG
jgi:D-arabinose 1-dehydrogenase-like Zn-dependent alcohol dehydrogenase